MSHAYYVPAGGLPPQTQMTAGRAIFTEAYAVIPRDVLCDIVTSLLPGWQQTRAWILARPMTGFAETFSQMILEVAPGGGASLPEPEPEAEGVYFVVGGELELTHDGTCHRLTPGSFVYLPPGTDYSVANRSDANATFHWIRKAYEPVAGLDAPDFFTVNEADLTPLEMPDTKGAWSTTLFVDPRDMRHDMHVTIVSMLPGGVIPFTETHVMEHGLYVLGGKAVYRLNADWVEVEAGDFMWLRAFCPQGCYAGGTEPFRYLLYKDMHRFPGLRAGQPSGPRMIGRPDRA